MFLVSYLGIWWRHDIWISEKLKFFYPKNEKSFQSEIKTFSLIFQAFSFRHTKQTSKNVTNTTYSTTYSPLHIKNIWSSKLKCSHRVGDFQACIWLILRHFKLKLSIKIQKRKKNCPSAPLMLFTPNPQLFSTLLVLWLAKGPAQKCYSQKNPVYNPVSIYKIQTKFWL